MREFWKQTMILSAIGFIAGTLVGSGFLALGGIKEYYAQNGINRLASYIALSGLLGAANMGTTTVYALERWSLLRCTLTHLAIVMSSICAVGFSLGWLRLSDPVTLCILFGCVVVYFIIWAIMYSKYKRQIRRMNEALERWKSEQDEI